LAIRNGKERYLIGFGGIVGLLVVVVLKTFSDVIPFGQDEFPVSFDAENSSWNMDRLPTILPHDL